MWNTFLFKGKFYDQSDGVAMGSPLAPVLANLFMGHYEKEWLSNYNGILPSYYYQDYTRYVDDIFSVSNSHDEAKWFFSILVQDHLKINLQWKQRLTKLFPFWMFLLIIITIFCMQLQSPYSGLLLNFNSSTSRFYKISLIKCLINRTYTVNNTWLVFIMI